MNRISKNLQLNAVMSEVNTGVIIIDNECNVVNFNQKALTLFKIEKLDIGENLFDAVTNTETNIALQKLLKRDEDNSPIHIESKKFKYLYRVSVSAVKDENEQTLGKIITVNKHFLSKRFKKLREDFVANVSHELKTPLTVVKGAIETLLNGALNDKEDTEHFVKVIEKHTDRLHTLISDILNLSSIEQKLKKKNVDFSICSTKNIIDEVVEMYSEKIDKAGMKLVLNCEYDIAFMGNKQLIELAVSNLIDNAVKYNKPGGYIRIKTEKIGKKVLISVKDSGIGIEHKNIPRLFERFYRVDKIKSRNIGGTGLGLSIVKQIVKVHKGLITIKSEIGIGSNFTIALPIDDE